MAAGPLNQRWRFEKRSESADGYGNTVSTWSAQFTAWTGRRDLRGGEGVMASRLEGKQPAILTVRAATSTTRTITTDWRAVNVNTGQVMNVRSVTETPDRKFIEMLCEAGVADG